MDDQEIYREKRNREQGGSPEEMDAKVGSSVHEKPKPHGFVHVLWLLVVLSAFLFGASVVNIVLGMKIYETSKRQSSVIERLNISMKEVQKTVLHLSEITEEMLQAEDEYDTGVPLEEEKI
ncbi:MAG: hypothetical protein JW836_03660 [Deltaproteobacteria bacterium]|nr:hypothetical protein [Deltaproteobacteria bacterium]